MKIEMYLCVFNECMVNCAFISAACLAWFDKEDVLDSDVRMNFGWTIVFIYMVLMYGLILNALQKMIRIAIVMLKKLMEKYKEKKM